MNIRNIIAELEEIAPPDTALDFDEGRIGWIVKGKEEINKVVCALDATPYAVSEAVRAGADLMVVHHPPIWDPLRRIEGYYREVLKTALAADLNIYAMHTNFDRAKGGINDALADLLGLTNCMPMTIGVVGDCMLSPQEIAGKLDESLKVYGKMPEKRPFRLGVIGGSGFDFEDLEEAAGLGADAFLSSELKHSVLIGARMPLLESTHYATESIGMRVLAERKGWTFIPEKPYSETYLPKH